MNPFKFLVGKNWLKILIILVLLSSLAFIFARKIELSAVDLGRHLENGRLVLNNSSLLFTNYYSYTEPNFRFINHHWLSGLIFYGVYLIGGFSLLSIFNILLILAVFLIFFQLGQKRSNFYLTAIFSVPIILLLGERVEIRPEIFSYLLLALLWKLSDNRSIKFYYRALFTFLIFVFWANLHIYFFIGLTFLGFRLLEKIILIWDDYANNFLKKIELIFGRLRRDLIIIFLALFGALFSPNHWQSLLYPLNIFKNYGYQVAENKSIFFLEKLFLNHNFLVFKIVLVSLIIGFLINLYTKKLRLRSDTLFSFFIATLALFASRNLALFALISLVLMSDFWYQIFLYLQRKNNWITGELIRLKKFIIFISLLTAIILFSFLLLAQIRTGAINGRVFGLGLKPNSLSVFDFFLENKLNGPIFNNYDSGSAIIFGLSGREKVFIDNRPEAYSVDFLKNVYISMQENESDWQFYLNQYDFESIIFSYADSTPWALSFLTYILYSNEWSLVYFDDHFILLIKKEQLTLYNVKSFQDSENFRARMNFLLEEADLQSEIRLASLALVRGEWQLAENIYLQALEKYPRYNRLNLLLAYLYSNHESPAYLYRSIFYFNKALSLQPYLPRVYNDMAMVYWKLGDYSRAESFWIKSLNKNRADQHALYYLNQIEDLKKEGLLFGN